MVTLNYLPPSKIRLESVEICLVSKRTGRMPEVYRFQVGNSYVELDFIRKENRDGINDFGILWDMKVDPITEGWSIGPRGRLAERCSPDAGLELLKRMISLVREEQLK
jgi:hypothetical protein